MQYIYKTRKSQQAITFAVLVPNEPDSYGHVIGEEAIMQTAFEFVENLSIKKINVDHLPGTDFDHSQIRIVESYILPNDILMTAGTLPKGTRMLTLKFYDNELYEKVLNGEFVGVSMEGYDAEM